MKSKGSRAERELLHMFWETGKWAALRAPGSGSMPRPCPDVLAGNGKRYIAVECKSIKADRKYFDKKEIDDLIEFSRLFGAEPWIGMRFDNMKWYFLKIEELGSSKGGMAYASKELVMKKGLTFEELIGEFLQKKIA